MKQLKFWVYVMVAAVFASIVPATSADAITSGRFDDDDGSIHESNIEALAAAGITLGCSSDGTLFCPGDPVTREQMASFLTRGLQLAPAPSAGFLDVVPGSVHAANIDSLAAAGITLGCSPDGSLFCPGDPVTREQMASFLVRGLGLTPITPGVDFSSELTVAFLAMAQGDSAIYVGPCGEAAIVDAPRQKAPEIKARLAAWGISDLEWILVSHYDSDNVGDVFELGTDPDLSIGLVYDRGGDRDANDTNSYRDYYDWVVSSGKRRPVQIGNEFGLCSGADRVSFTVVSVGTDGTAVGDTPVTSENDKGVCVKVEFKDFDLATCGDINGRTGVTAVDVETPAAAVIGDVEVVRVNRHGSFSSSNDAWRTILSPEVAVLTVGVNVFGYPDAGVVAAWQASSDLFKTNSEIDDSVVDGDIVISTRGTSTFRLTTTGSGISRAYFLDEN